MNKSASSERRFSSLREFEKAVFPAYFKAQSEQLPDDPRQAGAFKALEALQRVRRRFLG
jgi:hypothetical protein